MEENKVHSFVLVAGKPQHGKTYYTEKLAQKVVENDGFVFVYNAGRDKDWKIARVAEPVPFKEVALKMGIKKQSEINYFIQSQNTVDYWRVDGQYYHSKDLPIAFKGKALKCYRDIDLEQQIYSTFFKYFHGGLIVMDDNRSAGKRTQPLLQLYSRINHTGRGYTKTEGINLAVVYHNLDTPPNEIYDFLTHIVLFQVGRPPKLGMPQLDDALNASVDWLDNAPKFSRCEIPLLGSEITPKFFEFKG